MSGQIHFRRTLRKMAVLFRRDFAVARSYRAAFLLELFETLFGVAGFYFLSRFIESPQLERALAAGWKLFFIRPGRSWRSSTT